MGGRPLSQLLPSLPSTDDHFPEPPSRRWQSGAPAPCLGRDPGVVWPGGTTRMQSHTFWDGGWERVLQSLSATCPERDVMGQPATPAKRKATPLSSLCSIQHGMRNAKRTARTEDSAALQLFAPGLRCREQSHRAHGLDSHGTREPGPTGTSIGPEGFAPRWKGLDHRLLLAWIFGTRDSAHPPAALALSQAQAGETRTAQWPACCGSWVSHPAHQPHANENRNSDWWESFR